MKKNIIYFFFTLFIFVIESCYYFPQFYNYDELVTGESFISYDDEIIIGSCCKDGPAGLITVMKKSDERWTQKQLIYMEEVANQYRGPICFQINEKFLVVGLDSKRKQPGAVLVLRKNQDEWEKAYIIKSPLKEKDDLFGYTIALNGNKLLVGMKDSKEGGKAYLFTLMDDEYNLEKIFYPPDYENNKRFGSSVTMNDDFIIIIDTMLPNGTVYKLYENDDKEQKYKLFRTQIYLYEPRYYSLVSLINNCTDNIKMNSINNVFGRNPILSDNKLIFPETDNSLVVYDMNTKLENKISIDSTIKFYRYSLAFIPSIPYNYAYSNNTLIAGNKIFKIEENSIREQGKLVNKVFPEQSLESIKDGYLKGNLLLTHDYYCDNAERIKQQEQNNKDHYRTGCPVVEIEKPINQGRVHIMRLSPDGSYIEEAIIARRTTSEGKIEFYDLLHDE